MSQGLEVLKIGVTLAIFTFSGKISFSSDILNKCFQDSLISPKYFLTTWRFILSYPRLLSVFNEKKASFNSFIDRELFLLQCVLFKKT